MMRLSDAIRLGSMLHPQGFGDFQQHDSVGGLRTCALGAASVAIGQEFLSREDVIRAWPWLSEDYLTQIMWLNDGCRWSREHIADIVESIENALPAMGASPKTESSELHSVAK